VPGIGVQTTPLILIVDEQPTEQAALGDLLCRAGYECHGAESGAAALQLLQTRDPAVIVLSAALCPAAGDVFAKRLAAAVADGLASVMVLTDAPAADAPAAPGDAAPWDRLFRPVRPAELLARVAWHLRLRHTRQRAARQSRNLQRALRVLAKFKQERVRLARTDPLTGLLNRGAWERAVAVEHDRAKRYHHPYSIVLIGLDHFQRLNEASGRAAGDACLVQVARTLAQLCRSTDVVARLDGGEFAILVPETLPEAACELAERIRQTVRGLAIAHPQSDVAHVVTASIGVAAREFDCWEATLTRAADARLTAKQTGRDRVYSSPGAALSAPSAPLTPPGPAVAAGAAPRERRRCVLVVDDNASDRALFRRCLEKTGYEVLEAADGATALTLAHTDALDVITLDVNMPGMDGLECARRLKADQATRDVPLIMVSAHGETREIIKGLQAGADEYVTKPLVLEELVHRVHTMARLRSQHRDLVVSLESRSEQARMLTHLLDFCQILTTADHLDAVLAATVAVAAEVAASRRVAILLPDAQRQRLAIARSCGIAGNVAAALRTPIAQSAAGEVFRSGRPAVINTPGDAAVYKNTQDSRLLIGVPRVVYPLGSSGQVVGVLTITERLHNRPFRSAELCYVDMIANMAGAAIHGLLNRGLRDQALDSVVIALATLAEHRDNDTGKHIDRMTQYCLILANDLRRQPRFAKVIDDAFLDDLERAGPLHDIGKVAIPDHILLKPGRLTPEEMEAMKPHTVIGAETIHSVAIRAPGVHFLEMAENIAHAHHEWWDGSGYPRRLSGESIPLCARIAALADVYDALTTKRVYKEAFSHDRAAAIIAQASGTQFDPAVVQAFLDREDAFAALASELGDSTPRNRAADAAAKSASATSPAQ
jgi:diguanylate cyclase (GGDEF)-like protein